MKKLSAIILALLLLVPFTVLAMTAETDTASDGATATADVVYVSDSGSDSNSGLEPGAPLKSLSKAYAAVGNDGGTIRIVGTMTNEAYQISSGFYEPKHDGKIIIEGYGDSPKFVLANNAGGVRSRFYLQGDTEIRNLTIHHDKGGLIGACHHTLTMGDGLTMTGEGTLYLFGGCGELAKSLIPQSAHTTNDTHLIVKSGQYESINGGDYANTSTSMCYATGATHTIEILGDVQADFIVLGHNKKTSAGVTANFILNGNTTTHNSPASVAYIGGVSAGYIDNVNAYIVGGSITQKTISVTCFNAGGSFNLYYDAENEATASLVSTLLTNARANSGLTVTENALSDVCANGHYYGDDAYCHYCNEEKPCDHVNTYENVKTVATCVIEGVKDVICKDCGTVLESDISTGVDSTAHGKKHLVSADGAYDLICNDCGETVLEAAAAENKIYVSDNGSIDSYGLSADAPLSSLTTAYELLSEVGGEILIVDSITAEGNANNPLMGGVFIEPAHAEKITVKSAGETKATLVILNTAPHYYLTGDTEFTNIIIKGSMGNVMAARHNHLTMGVGLEMSYPSGTGFWVVGGCQAGSAVDCGDTTDTHLTFYSGTYANIIGGYRHATNGSYPHASNEGTNRMEFLGDITVSGVINAGNTYAASDNVLYVFDANVTTGSHFYFAGSDTTTGSMNNVTIIAKSGSLTYGGAYDGGITRVHGDIKVYYSNETDAAALISLYSKYVVGTLSDYCINELGAHDFGDGENCLVCGSSKACQHTETTDVITKHPTCSEGGLYNVVCDACGVIVEADVAIDIDSDAHGIIRYAAGDVGYDLVCDDCKSIIVDEAAYEPVVYVSDNGEGVYGNTAEDAISDLLAAYERLANTGGTIYVIDNITLPKTGANQITKGGVFTEPAHSKKIKITTVEGAETQASVTFYVDALHWYLSGDLEISNLTITSTKGSIIAARHYHLTMGEELSMVYPSGVGLWLVGGCQEGCSVANESVDTHITVYSGTYANIIGGFRAGTTSEYPHQAPGNHTLELLGDITVTGYITPANTLFAAGDMFIVVDGNITSGSYFYFAGVNTSNASVNNVTVFIKSGSITAGGGASTFPGGITRVKGTAKVYYSNTTDAAALIEKFGGIGGKYIAGRITEYCLDTAGEHTFVDGVCGVCGREPVVLGDLDTDLVVTNADIALLIRVLAGWSEEYDVEAIDLNGDAKINNRDAIEIIKILALVEE